MLEINGNDREAAQALDRLYIKAERWGDLTRLLEDLLKRGALPERDLVGIQYRMAQIEHDRQNDRETALEHLRVVLSGDPDHPGAITMLEGMLDDIAVQGQAAELLEPVYAARADWPSLIKIGEIRLLQTEEPAAAARLDETDRAPVRGAAGGLRQRPALVRQGVPGGPDGAPQPGAARSPGRQAQSLARPGDACSSDYLEGEMGEDPAVLDIVRRTAEIFDQRLGQPPRGARSTTGGCSTRAPTIATSRSCSRGLSSAGARGRSCAS